MFHGLLDGPIALLAALGVCAVTFLYNWVYAVYQRAAADGDAVRSANTDTALYAMSLVSLGSLVVVGWWVVVPEIIANWLGTYYGTRWTAGRARHTH